MFEPYRPEPYSDFRNPGPQAAYRGALEQVRGQLGGDHPLVIGGERVFTDRFITSIDPCNLDRVVGRSAAGGPAELERAMDAAEAAFEIWSQWTMEARAQTLVRLAATLRRHKFELAAWETFEAAKNYAEAEGDVAEAIDFCEYYARDALRWSAPAPTYAYPGEENSTSRIPMGVGVIIPPWNFPLAILVGSAVGPAVVGNTVVIKPSPSTPVIAAKFMECVEEAGVPPGVFNLLTGEDADLGDALVDHPRTRFINFTGSVATGLHINERAARAQPGQTFLKRVYTEMGGKDALIVDETVDLDEAAAVATTSGYGFQGQKCSAMSRLIVTAQVHDGLLERLKARVEELRMGPAEENFDITAVINRRQCDKIVGYLQEGSREARLVTGGGRAEGNGYYIRPTIFADVDPTASIASEEIFGPVVSVLKARDFDHALEIANGTPFGLTGGVMSRDRERLERARREFRVGNLYLNRKITGSLVGVQPFGGLDMSGSNSKAGGPEYLRLFMEAKTVTERF